MTVREDALAVEEPLEIRVGGHLAVGHDAHARRRLRPGRGLPGAEGVVRPADQSSSMRYCAGTDDDGLQTLQRHRRRAGAGVAAARRLAGAPRLHVELVRRLRQGQRSTPCTQAARFGRPTTRALAPSCSWRAARTGCARRRGSSTAPAGCTPPGCSTRPASCWPARGRRPAQRGRQGRRLGAAGGPAAVEGHRAAWSAGRAASS